MARVHGGSHLLNTEGQPIENASISIYLAGTETDAILYTDEFSSTTVTTSPQLTTTTNGYFELWLADQNSANGYATSQKFKIVWSKTGVASGFIDYVDMFPAMIAVDESDTNTSKDKSVSNYLANLWENHRLDDGHIIHGIEEVDSTSTTSTKNKLVSNNLSYEWDKHNSLTFATSATSGSTYVTGTDATSADFPHGIQPFNLSDSLEATSEEYGIRNRLISFHYGKKGDDHLDVDYSDEPHGMEPVDVLSTDTEINKLVSNNIIKVLYDTIEALELRITALEEA